MSTFSSSVLRVLTLNSSAHTYIANDTTWRTFGRRDIGSICTSCVNSSDAPDIGSCYAGAEVGDKGKESQLVIEQQLAQWITMKNFLLVTQGKAILQLYGEGDLTGDDETFSSIQVSMKPKLRIDPKSQHRYNIQTADKVQPRDCKNLEQSVEFLSLEN
ncbi:hypothetical protein JB92DRAFT_2826166 [Gautieria morchelliformis]|nr:hypothetical protein JB92DRAFT_2826166 [Gautieria morchelliformis]